MNTNTSRNHAGRAYRKVVHHAGKATRALHHHSRRLVRKHILRDMQIPTQAQALRWLEDSFGVTDFDAIPEMAVI